MSFFPIKMNKKIQPLSGEHDVSLKGILPFNSTRNVKYKKNLETRKITSKQWILVPGIALLWHGTDL